MSNAGETLYESPFFVVVPVGERLYVVRRTRAKFETTAEIDAEFGDLIGVLEGAKPKGIVHDLRLARGRNDASFEAAHAVHRDRFLRSSERSVILVGSAIGQLQVKRHLELDGITHVAVLRDEAEARAAIGAGPAVLD